MENIELDIRYALGRFRAQPISTLVIVLMLALGIGATSAIFSVVNGLLLQATPFDDSDRLVILEQIEKNTGRRLGLSVPELFDYREQSSNFESIAEYHNMTFTMYGQDDPLRVRTGVVSANFFDILGIQPILGRLFNTDEDAIGAEPLVILTYEFWQKEFAGRKDITNLSVEMNNRAHKVIGVLPHFPQFPDVNDVYMAVPSCPWRSSEGALTNRGMRMMRSFAKLKSEATFTQVNQELSSISDRLYQAYPDAYTNQSPLDAQVLSLNEELVKENRPYLLTLLATTLLLFLIACANVTNLTLSQHAKRQREFAVRASLGASRWRLAQLLLTESILLALVGGLLGLTAAYLGLDFLKSFASHFTSLASEISLDTNVMLFALVVSILAGIISGLMPSLSQPNLTSALKEGGKASFSTRNGVVRNSLLVFQFALSLTLLVGAGLSLKSLNKLQNVDGGFNSEKVEIVQMDLNWSVYENPRQRWQFSQKLLSEVKQLPYVESVGLGMTYPMDTVAVNFGNLRQALRLDDRDYNPDDVLENAVTRRVSHGYFETIGARLLQGRFIRVEDDEAARRVAVINRSLAEHLWPNKSAINHRISFDNGENWVTIIGVVGDIKERLLSSPADFQIYFSMAQFPVGHFGILAKTKQAGVDFTADIRDIVAQLDSRQPLSKSESLQQAVDNSISLQQFVTQLLGIFSGLALLITISGISGVMGYLVNIRSREVGIRMAIGADKSSVIKLILTYGLKLTLLGLLLGFITAFCGGVHLTEYLFESEAFDLGVYATALSILLIVSIVACFTPAYKASSIEPMRALKSN
ncbi:ABC transporter permease [Aliikangiella coralliicola]|uniref:ABC transporter permease n=1 Tax=Aliikangiella coralliicola TaxID=2592383 RepID=A0A545UBM1_9GAMM|nr:ABC transporter permease [Aliikangiella coralliicola]TQV86862.1 ABC transporter permease [Aliikangiella coralliicola]